MDSHFCRQSILVVRVKQSIDCFIVRSCHFSCSFDNAKNLSTEVFNAIFGKIGGYSICGCGNALNKV